LYIVLPGLLKILTKFFRLPEKSLVLRRFLIFHDIAGHGDISLWRTGHHQRRDSLRGDRAAFLRAVN
jgi:hypothetical protein